MRLKEKVELKAKNAIAYIKTGRVLVNGHKIVDPNYKLLASDKVKIKLLPKYVSRGAYKLIAALDLFKIKLQSMVVLDIGASTGGFTQVALERGASKVYALDVGTNQLAYKIRMHKQVVVFEKTNLKTIHKAMFKEKIDVVLVDVSFISVRRVFDVLAPFSDLKVIVLIKPQFEAFKDEVSTGGYVNIKTSKRVLQRIKDYALLKGFKLVNYGPSPLKGVRARNNEYISLFVKENNGN